MGKPQASMRIAPELLAKLVALDLAGRRARQIVRNFEPPRQLRPTEVSKRLPLPKLRPQPHSQVMDNGIATSSRAVDLSWEKRV
jgi:hypothetical protein